MSRGGGWQQRGLRFRQWGGNGGRRGSLYVDVQGKCPFIFFPFFFLDQGIIIIFPPLLIIVQLNVSIRSISTLFASIEATNFGQIWQETDCTQPAMAKIGHPTSRSGHGRLIPTRVVKLVPSTAQMSQLHQIQLEVTWSGQERRHRWGVLIFF